MQLKTIQYPTEKSLANLLKRPALNATELEKTVQKILNDIRKNGDTAIKNYTLSFDKVKLSSIKVPEKEIANAEKKIEPDLKKAINLAAKNIRTFHMAQQQPVKKINTTEGVTCWQKSVAIEKVGLYIPGGTAPLFSSVLMLGIPAKIAGCKQIILCTPPQKNGTIHPAILYAAKITGINEVFAVGGVQAIGAMAYGTKTIPKVNKIFGPGNQYVTTAKQLVSRTDVAIDMPAGPSEVAIMADDSAVPAFVAADLLSQAEHGTDSQVLLVTTSTTLIKKVENEITIQLQRLSRKTLAEKSLKNSKAIVVKNSNEMIKIINLYAPEHLIISVKNANKIAEKIINAGSVFIGNFTPESAGDYASGTNHTLPTHGWASAYNGVNLDSYVKKITFQEISKAGLINIGKAVITMAEAEQLTAHARAVGIRLNKLV